MPETQIRDVASGARLFVDDSGGAVLIQRARPRHSRDVLTTDGIRISLPHAHRPSGHLVLEAVAFVALPALIATAGAPAGTKEERP